MILLTLVSSKKYLKGEALPKELDVDIILQKKDLKIDFTLHLYQ